MTESKKLKKDFSAEASKVPPQSIEIEAVILGSLMIETDSILRLINYYTPDVFYLESHRLIFTAILELFRKNEPIEMITVTRKLKEMGVLEDVGGAYYIAQLSRNIVSTANLEYHARIVFQDYIRRKAIEYSHDIFLKSYDISIDVFDLIKMFEQNHIELTNFIDKPDINPTDMVNQFVDNVASHKPPTSSLFVNRTVGIPSLDKIIRWAPNKLLLLAGAAKSGKSKLVSFLVWQLLENDKQTSVLWVTLEDTANDLLAAYCSMKILVKPKDILQRKTSNEQRMGIIEASEQWKKYDIEFVEESVTIAQIKTKAMIFSKNRPDRFIVIVIDNLLSLGDKYNFSRNMVQFYDYVIGVVADIRRSTNAFIFLLHHMNDEYSDESNLELGFRPSLTHIKGSEATRRVPNYTLMMNTTISNKSLLNQYTGEKRFILERLTILDPGTIRDEANVGDEALIRLYSNLNYNYFEEVQS